MNYTMNEVDEVRKRTKVSYEQAKEALDHSEGDVLGAVIYLEGRKESKTCPLNDTMDKLKALIDEGFISQIQVRKNGSVLFDIPVVAGAFMLTFWTLPFSAALLAAIASECDVRIVRRDGAESNISEVTVEKLSELVANLKAEFVKWKEKFDDQSTEE